MGKGTFLLLCISMFSLTIACDDPAPAVPQVKYVAPPPEQPAEAESGTAQAAEENDPAADDKADAQAEDAPNVETPKPADEVPLVAKAGDVEGGVVISGSILWQGQDPGALLNVDFITKGPPVEIVYSLANIGRAGPFELTVPKGMGNVWMYAFIEGSEPVVGGTSKRALKVGRKGISGVSITLNNDFDLGATGLGVKMLAPSDESEETDPKD